MSLKDRVRQPALLAAGAVRRQATDALRAASADPLLWAGAVALYVFLEWLSFLHEHDGLPVTPWNPGLGFLLALIILKGSSYAIVLFVGVMIAEVLVQRSDLPLHIVAAVGAIVTGAYTLVAALLRGRLRLDQRVLQAREIFLLFAGGLVGALLVSTLLSVLLLSISFFDLSDIAGTATPLVLGDVIGIVVVTPLVLRAYLRRHELGHLAPLILIEYASLGLFAVLAIMLTLWPAANQQHLFYLLFLPVVVAAVRHGIDGACAALAIVQLVLVGILHLHGSDLPRFTEYQVLMLMLTLTGLVVGALVSERQLADERADIAAQRLRQMQAEAARAARLNLVSGMAAALAHEISQPMTATRALARSVQLLLQQPQKDLERAEANVGKVVEQIDLAGAIVQRMREFIRRGEPHISTLDIKLVLEEAFALVQASVNERKIRLSLDVPNALPPVFGDRVQIQQVIINLVRNAAEAIAAGQRGDGRIAVGVTPSSDAGHLTISVVDNGIGIDAETVQSLFEPLNTSRPDGIGLGLSICKTIVQAHGGRMWLASSVPGRSEFCFTLPTGTTKA